MARFRKKRKVITKNGRASKTAVIALKTANKAMSMVAGELKILDNSAVATAIPDGAGVIVAELTNSAQGSIDSTRNGNQITLKMLEFQAFIVIASAANSSQVRVMLVQDKQTNGAGFAVDDVLESVTNLLSLISPKESDNKKRFNLLFDKVFVLNRPGISSVQSNVRHIKFRKKLNMKIQYNGTGTTIAALRSNSLALLVISNEPTNEPTIDHFLRLSYIDN